MMKRSIALGMGIVLALSVAAVSFAASAGSIKADIQKAKTQIATLNKKISTAKKAEKAALGKQLKAQQARLQSL